MTAVLIAAGAVLIAAGLFLGGVASADRVRAALAREHGEHSARNPSGEFRAVTEETAPRPENRWTPSALLSSDELEELDERVDALLPNVQADRPVTPVRVGHAPWTGEIPAVPDADAQYAAWARRMAEEKAQQERVDWVRAQLEECRAKATAEDMRRVLASLRAMPVCGEKCVATVLAATAEAEAAA